MNLVWLVALFCAISTSAIAQPVGPNAAATPAPSATPRAAWSPLAMPSPPPPSDAEISYRLQTQQAILTNLLFAVFSPYCRPDDKISSIALNGKPEAPVYPVVVTCVRDRWRVDAPTKVTKL